MISVPDDYLTKGDTYRMKNFIKKNSKQWQDRTTSIFFFKDVAGINGIYGGIRRGDFVEAYKLPYTPEEEYIRASLNNIAYATELKKFYEKFPALNNNHTRAVITRPFLPSGGVTQTDNDGVVAVQTIPVPVSFQGNAVNVVGNYGGRKLRKNNKSKRKGRRSIRRKSRRR